MNLPNKLTVARVILVPIFIILYIAKFYIPALIVFIIASITDTLDGRLARKRNQITNFGKIMDPLADKILVYSAFCLLIPEYVKSWMLIIILAREFTISGIRTVAASEGIVIAAGLSGKLKTALQMVAVPFILFYIVLQQYLPDQPVVLKVVFTVSQILLWASIIMTVYSGAEYIIKNKQVFKR